MLSHFSCTRLFATLWTPLSMEFTRQEYWSRLHALFQKVFPTQGWKLHLISCLLHWQAGSLPPRKPHISAHIQLYRSVNTRLITTSQNSIPINKRMVKDGIYACSQLLCICINAAQINFNIMLSERLLIWDYLLCDSTYMKFRNRENKLIATISRSWGMLFIIIMGVA